MEKRESKLLQIVSIVTIIFTVLGLLVSIAAQLFAAQLLASAETAGAQNVSTPVFITILGYLTSALSLAAGILGVMYWNRPEKAYPCILAGLGVLICKAASAVYSLITSLTITQQVPGLDAETASMIRTGTVVGVVVSIVLTMVLPVLYLIGAVKLSKMQAE